MVMPPQKQAVLVVIYLLLLHLLLLLLLLTPQYQHAHRLLATRLVPPSPLQLPLAH
jgi:hypothetical protein